MTEATETIQITKPPFPWFGGKSRVAEIVWQRFGDVPNYVEPFFGSGAVLLLRPHPPGIETINDIDCYVANFWRAVQTDPDAVAEYADWPVNEADCHARHKWLLHQADFRERLRTEPDYYDAKIAGWWVWGQCQWIGCGWCDSRCYDGKREEWKQLPHLGDAGQGVHRPSQQRPHLGDAGRGVHRPSHKLPHLGNAGQRGLLEYMAAIAQRLRRVRVCCGDWSRICGPTPTTHMGLTGVFLDPPYMDTRDSRLYANDSQTVAADVHAWAEANGDNPKLRIAVCGYEGEWEPPDDWETVEWKAAGGYGSAANLRGRDNAHRERIWFSPHCLRTSKSVQAMLWD